MFRRPISIVLIFLLGAHHAISKANNTLESKDLDTGVR